MQTILSYLGIGGGGGGLWASRYASEMQASPSLDQTFSKFYIDGTLTAIILVFVALTLLTVWWMKRGGKFKFRREGLLVIVWLIVLIGMVWPGKGQARFERLWWPIVPVLAGVGVGASISVFWWLSREPSMQDWMGHLHKPVLFALCCALLMTPFIQNSCAIANQTTPPPEWSISGLDAEFIETFDWLRENTPENSVVSIQWSYGHLLTGVSERATVTDGAETRSEEGKWENEEGTVRPPDYIYTVVDDMRYIYGVDITYLGQYQINGRRIDVQRLPTMDENEFQWLMHAYRDNYGCKIDYVVFIYNEYYSAWSYYNNTQPMNILWNAKRINTELQSQGTEGQNYIFNFGENRENIVLDTQTGDVYLRTENENLYLDGYGNSVLAVDETEKITSYSYGGFSSPSGAVDILETLLVFTYEDGTIATAWLIEAVSAEINGRPTLMAMKVFEGNLEGADYLEIAHTSPNGLVKVAKVNHVPRLASPADEAVTNNPVLTLRWTSSIGAVKYELVVDNNSDFSSPEVLENTSDLSYAPDNTLADSTYYWRVRGFNEGNETVGWSSTRAFTIDTVEPNAPTLQSPLDNAALSDNTVTFGWAQVSDAESYDLEADNNADFSSPEVDETGLTDNTYTVSAPGLADDNYSWHVRARDAAGNESDWSTTWTFGVQT